MKSMLSVFAMIPLIGLGQSVIQSRVYPWEGVDNSRKTVTKTMFEGESDGFEYLNISAVSLGKGKSHQPPATNEPRETLIIMKKGRVNQKVGSKIVSLGPGSITLLSPDENFEIQNEGNEMAICYMIQWRTKNFQQPMIIDQKRINPTIIDWDTLTFEATDKGGRRKVIRQPTPMLKEFEMHVTTLNEGMRSHPPHTHLDEEIILVRFGQVEESIDGNLYEAGEGSLIFLRSMVPHGIRNLGKGACEYYAFRWIPR